MEILRWKTRIAVLWIFLAVAMSASMVLSFMEPGVIEDIIAGEMDGWEISEGLLAFFGIFWLIPLIMAVLSLTLKDSANRWTNIVLGIVVTVWNIVHLIMHLAEGELPLDHLMFMVAMIVVSGLIFWYAWRWPELEA